MQVALLKTCQLLRPPCVTGKRELKNVCDGEDEVKELGLLWVKQTTPRNNLLDRRSKSTQIAAAKRFKNKTHTGGERGHEVKSIDQAT